ncbi:MAG TPA: endonuclease/exonuclease/phosphatase family protein, partial [Flavobacteriales bacterium]|nr:endonuclease/exonuclease/phosphatase family protein [Flavobacteriales bacterium]
MWQKHSKKIIIQRNNKPAKIKLNKRQITTRQRQLKLKQLKQKATHKYKSTIKPTTQAHPKKNKRNKWKTEHPHKPQPNRTQMTKQTKNSGNKKRIISPKKLFDSTKGYPGEGPAKENNSRGKANRTSKDRGDQHFNNTLKMWKTQHTDDMEDIGKLNTIGHDIWYSSPPKLQWNNLQGNICALNMRGRGEMLDRQNLWSAMAKSHTMIIILSDHRCTEPQLKNFQTEIEDGWIGLNTERRMKCIHSPARNKHVGGITIAVHPIISRYITLDTPFQLDDPRGWGRWTCTALAGKEKIIIIGTYGPTKNTDDDAVQSMWQTQEKLMGEINREERESDPQQQYIKDITEHIREIQKKKYKVILMGDTNINWNADTLANTEWKNNMADRGMLNTIKTFWPSTTNIHTFAPTGSWIDHIYVDKKLLLKGAIRE